MKDDPHKKPPPMDEADSSAYETAWQDLNKDWTSAWVGDSDWSWSGAQASARQSQTQAPHSGQPPVRKWRVAPTAVHPLPEDPHEEDRGQFFGALATSLCLLCAMWTVKMIELSFDISFSHWGLRPGETEGLWGLLTMPWLHSDLEHLVNNSLGVFLLSWGTFYLFPRVAWRVWLLSMVGSGLLVWWFGRTSVHIGASGVVYALSAFLFASGCLRRDRRYRGMALVVALLYGGAIWGIFPIQVGVSWEGHLFGALMGVTLALFWRREGLAPQEDEGIDEDDPLPAGYPPNYWMHGSEDRRT